MVNFLKLDFRTSANGQYSKWKPEKIIHKGEEMVEKCQTRVFGHSTSVYNRLAELVQSQYFTAANDILSALNRMLNTAIENLSGLLIKSYCVVKPVESDTERKLGWKSSRL